MIVTGNRFNTPQNNIKFGNKIPTKLVEDAKTSLKYNNGFIELKNGDSISSVVGNDTLVIKRPLPSPDNLIQEITVKLKKRLFGGFKVASAHSAMHQWSHKPVLGGLAILRHLTITPIGESDNKKAAKETQEILERVAKEDVSLQAIKALNKCLRQIKGVI